MKIFENKALAKTALWAKEERIDKQYYVDTQQVIKSTKDSCNEMINKAEDFLLKIKVIISQLNNEEINKIRKEFKKLVE